MRAPPYTPPRTVFCVRLDTGATPRVPVEVLAEVVDHDERRALHMLRPSDPGYREQMGVARG